MSSNQSLDPWLSEISKINFIKRAYFLEKHRGNRFLPKKIEILELERNFQQFPEFYAQNDFQLSAYPNIFSTNDANAKQIDDLNLDISYQQTQIRVQEFFHQIYFFFDRLTFDLWL